MSKCRFTIAVPIFNCEKFLHQCIDSVLEQDFDDFELLLIDDCSTDSSSKIIQSYNKKDNRVKALSSNENVGVSQTRNKGIKEASGTYLLFLDSDDFLAPGSLKIISENLQSDTELLLLDHYEIRPDGSRKKIRNIEAEPSKKFFFTKENILDLALESYKRHFSNRLFGSCWGRVYKTSIIKQHCITFDKNLPMIEDVVFNYHFMQWCDRLLYINEYLYNYRIHDFLQSESSKLPENLIAVLDILFNSIESYYSKISQFNITEINQIASHKCMHYFIVFLVRICGGLYTDNFKETYGILNEYINSAFIKKCIKHYSPRQGHSKILPFLIKTRQVLLLILFGKIRYNKRYREK